MMNQLLIAGFTFLTIFSCSSQMKKPVKIDSGNPQPKVLSTKNLEKMEGIDTQMQNVITFKEGENKFLKEYEMNVTFTKVAEDSRCAKDVQCIWAGVATVDVQLMGTFTRPVNVKLSTLEDVKKGYTKSAVFNGYKITLVELNPYPANSNSKKANSGKNILTLQIVKIAGNQVEPGTR